MLNLQQIEERYCEVQLTEKQGVLHLRKPSKALYDALVKLSHKLNNMDDKQELEETLSLGVRILNRNIEGIEFENSDLNFTQADALVCEYMTWIMGYLRENSKN